MPKYLMKCGHISNGTTADGQPVCVICAGITPDALIVDHEVKGKIGLEGRKARCHESKNKRLEDTEVDSSWDLPFFEYKPDEEFDEYYDGSWGWD